jgi:hypothetical protein
VDAAVSGETLVNADRETIRAALISRRIEVAEALARMEAGVAATGHATETTTTKEPIDTNV